MKMEIETDKNMSYTKLFKINGKEYGKGIEKADIQLECGNVEINLYVDHYFFKEEDRKELLKNKNVIIHSKNYDV